jgi:murein DD-endopeptidase MepM/ murein hydrolase activator NlpD
MPKTKYRFNPESLSFDRISLGIRGLILKFLAYFFAGLVIAVIFNVAFSYFFDSPKERMLKRENEQYRLQYEIIEKKIAQTAAVLEDLQKRDDNIYRTIFETDPIPRSVREAGFGGVNRYNDLEGFENSDLIIETAKKLDKTLKKTYIQSKSYDQVIALAINKNEMLASIPAIQPISNKDLTRTASGWGWRIHPIYKIRKFHYGLDFTAATGTEIYSTGNGIVETIDRSFRGYGNMITINHGFGYRTLYAHISEFKVRQGQAVKRGDIIGYVGNTGTSTAPHLHYEVIKNNDKVNPINFFFNDLTPQQYNSMIEISTQSGQTFD